MTDRAEQGRCTIAYGRKRSGFALAFFFAGFLVQVSLSAEGEIESYNYAMDIILAERVVDSPWIRSLYISPENNRAYERPITELTRWGDDGRIESKIPIVAGHLQRGYERFEDVSTLEIGDYLSGIELPSWAANRLSLLSDEDLSIVINRLETGVYSDSSVNYIADLVLAHNDSYGHLSSDSLVKHWSSNGRRVPAYELRSLLTDDYLIEAIKGLDKGNYFDPAIPGIATHLIENYSFLRGFSPERLVGYWLQVALHHDIFDLGSCPECLCVWIIWCPPPSDPCPEE